MGGDYDTKQYMAHHGKRKLLAWIIKDNGISMPMYAYEKKE
jgi:hypothetical protein